MSVNTGRYYRDKRDDKNKFQPAQDGNVPRLDCFSFLIIICTPMIFYIY